MSEFDTSFRKSPKKALLVGGILVAALGVVAWLLIGMTNSRVPDGAELARVVKAWFTVTGDDKQLENGGRVPAGGTVSIAYEHSLAQPVRFVAVAAGVGGKTVWLAPSDPSQPPLDAPGPKGTLLAGAPPAGPSRLRLIMSVSPGNAGDWLKKLEEKSADFTVREVNIAVSEP